MKINTPTAQEVENWRQISRFDSERHRPEDLFRIGRLAVVTAEPTRVLDYRAQTSTPHVDLPSSDKSMKLDARPVGGYMTSATSSAAAGRALQQISYYAGLPAGHAGIYVHRGGGTAEAVASPAAVRLAVARERAGMYVAFISTIRREAVDDDLQQISEQPHSFVARERRQAEEVVGLTLGDMTLLLGGERALDALVDPAEHTIIRPQQQLLGIDRQPGDVAAILPLIR